MELMSASEAKSIATSVKTAVHEKQLTDIMNKISEAVNTGKLIIYVYFYPSEPVKQKLESLGYTVESVNHRNETTTTIFWG